MVIKTGVLIIGECAVTVGGHRLLTPQRESECISGIFQVLRLARKRFPAHVGVSLIQCRINVLIQGFPRACGVEPTRVSIAFSFDEFSPHTWGCITEKPLTIERQGLQYFCTYLTMLQEVRDSCISCLKTSSGGVPFQRRYSWASVIG